MRFRRSIVLSVSFLASSACALAQSGSITQDEHDKRVKADSDRNTKYHNNADDYPVNKSSAPNIPTPAARIPGSTKEQPVVNPVAAANNARVEAARPGMEREFAAELSMANRGDVNAIYSVALDYEHGYGTSPDIAKALSLYVSIADRSDAAAYAAGSILFEGTTFSNKIPKDEARGSALIYSAADRGNAKAAKEWSKYHPRTVHTAEDFPGMQRFAEDVFLEYGKDVKPTTEAESERLLHLKRDKNGNLSFKDHMKNSDPAFEAAKGNLYGAGVPVNVERALELFYLTVNQQAAHYVFWCIWKRTPHEADSLRAAVEKGDRYSYEHALYESSLGNLDGARQILEQTIYEGKGHPSPSQMLVDLSVMELEGKGGAKDVNSGLARLRSAVALGNRNGQYILGVIYERGLHGVAKDPAQAGQLFQAASAAGQTDAQKKLVQMGMARQ